MPENPLPTSATSPATNAGSTGQKIRNLVIALAAIALSVAVFLGVQTQAPTTSLSAMAEEAVPLETALTNGKPTFLEFYANWCTTCQAMAGDMANLKSAYGDRVNFVMLNVDNNKWLPEMLRYRVDGIPHFVYLDEAGEPLSTAIGEQPRLIMAENLDALLAHAPLPHQQTFGRSSTLEEPLARSSGSSDPRSHGGQVVN
ncbi:MAG: thioredoxin family protein [Cyanobacteria bacterium Co-bin13]|nr:thioredoxin family protein [Cyanobacteria bacterium Co-bin13]